MDGIMSIDLSREIGFADLGKQEVKGTIDDHVVAEAIWCGWSDHQGVAGGVNRGKSES